MSSIKGFTSLLGAIKTIYDSAEVQLQQVYATFQHLGAGKVALHTVPSYLAEVDIDLNIDASGSTKRVLAITGHGHRKYDIIRFTTGPNTGVEVQIVDVSDSDSVLLGQELPETPTASNGYDLYRAISPRLNPDGSTSISNELLKPVDFLDQESIAPTGANVIPRSSDPPLQVVAALASDVRIVQVISDVGEFVNLYTDALGTNLVAHLPLTPDNSVYVDLLEGDSVYIRNAKDVDIDQPNSIISMNFIGKSN